MKRTLSPSPKLSASATTPDVRTTRPALRTGSFGDGENALGGESKPESIATERRITHRAKVEDERGTGASDARPPYPEVDLLPTDTTVIADLRDKVDANTCAISGLTPKKHEEHIDGVVRIIAKAKGWDRLLEEYEDERERARLAPRVHCSVCGKFTRALSGICPDHPLEHV